MNEDPIQKHCLFSTGQENALYANELVKQAKRSLEFFSPHLDPKIYSQPEFVDNLVQFLIANSHNHVRILIQDSNTIVRNGHRMIDLLQRFTSTITIRKPSLDYAELHYSCLIADGSSMLYKERGDSFTGEYYYRDHVAVQRQLEKFNLIWDQAESDPELRRLYL